MKGEFSGGWTPQDRMPLTMRSWKTNIVGRFVGKAMGPPGAIVRCPCGNVLRAHESFHLAVTRNSGGQKGSVSQEMKVDVEVKRS